MTNGKSDTVELLLEKLDRKKPINLAAAHLLKSSTSSKP